MKIECSYCGEFLPDYQAEEPLLDKNDGKPCCDECYHEHFEFTCFWCDEYEDDEYMDGILVIAEECGGLPSGLYRILSKPYFISDMFNMNWLKDSFHRIGDLPPTFIVDPDDYPSGHLCRDCQQRVLVPRDFGRPEIRPLEEKSYD